MIIIFWVMSALALTPQPPKEILKGTVENLNAHQTLHNEGWLFIPSSKNALEFSQKMSIDSAAEAIEKIKKRHHKLKIKQTNVIPAAKTALETSIPEAKKQQAAFKKSSKQMANKLNRYSNESFKFAWNSLILGTISWNKLTNDEVRQIKKLTRIDETQTWGQKLRYQHYADVEKSWQSSINRAQEEFNQSYEKSGQRSNSLLALPDIIWGHLKAMWYGLVKPVSHSTYFAVEESFVLTEKTVRSLGGVLYYSTKASGRIIGENLKAGLLASVAILSFIAEKPVQHSLEGLGYINRVAWPATQVTSSLAIESAKTIGQSTSYAASMIYELGKESSKVAIGSSVAGLTLGLSSLTIIPAQTLLFSLNTAYFLVYDGPKLAVYAITGNIGDSSITDLPVGTVIDVNKLPEDFTKEILPVTQEELDKVLESIKRDHP